MSSAPKPVQISTDDYHSSPEEVRGAIDTLSRSLNPFLRDTVGVLSNGISLGANLAARIKTVEFMIPDPWIQVTFLNSWTNFGLGAATVAYRKSDDGYVRFKGLAKNGTMAAATFNLPAAYRPAEDARFAVVSNNAFGSVEVRASSGDVVPVAGTNSFHSFDGINFPAADPTPVARPKPFPLQIDIADLPGTYQGTVVLACDDITTRATKAVVYPRISAEATSVQGRQTLRIVDVQGLPTGRKYRLKLLVLT